MDEGALLAAWRGGDGAALEVLLGAHYDRVHALCRRMLGNEADALDATQDALVAAVRGLGRFDGRSSFATWIYRITTNACLDELRRRRRRPVPGVPGAAGGVARSSGGGAGLPRARAEADRAPAGVVGVGAAQGARDPADSVAARVDVDAALRALPAGFRTAVVLRDVCDLSYDEIAAILEVPVGTVRSRIARGRAALAAQLGAPGEAGLPRPPAAGNPDTGVHVKTPRAVDRKGRTP